MDSDQRLEKIDQRLWHIEERLSRLENTSGSLPAPAHISDDTEADSRTVATADASLLALTGKSILILGGAFLLRAATESAALPPQIGIALGLLYAMAWVVAAAFAARSGRRSTADFLCVVSAAVAYPILWEATTHFRVLSAVAAAVLLAGFSFALIFVARLHTLALPAWIATVGATFVALLLAYATKETIPFLFALTFLGVVALILSKSYVGWLLAIECDLFASFLLITTLLDDSRDSRSSTVVSLLLFALAWMTVTSRASVQVAVASLIGIAGASALVLSMPATTILWGLAAVVAAEIARRTAFPVFAVQSAAWGLLAAIGGGLFSFTAAALIGHDGAVVTPVPALIAAALSLVAFARLDFARLPLLAVAACGAAAVTIHAAATAINGDPGTQAIVRTTVLAAAAVALAWIGRKWSLPEASQLAVVTLVLTGVKVIAQELRSGSAVIMFIALAIYGGAMLAIARLRSTPATSLKAAHEGELPEDG